MLSQYLFFYGWLVISFLITYILGNSFFRLLGIKKAATFFSFIAGVILIPTVYALYSSSGLSILMGIPIILILYLFLFSWKKNFSTKTSVVQKRNNKELFFSFLVVSILFVIHLTYFYDFINQQAIAIKPDYSYYARLASYLRDTGIENTNIELFLSEPKTVLPYHYIEIWFAAILSKVFGIHSQFSLMLIVFPILYTTIYLGALEIVKLLRKKLGQELSNFDYVLAALILITVSCGFLYPNFIPLLKSDVWALSVHGTHKLVYVYVLLLAIFLFLFHKRLLEVSLMVALLVICQVNVAPAILITYTLYLLVQLIFKKIDIKQFFRLMILPLAILLFFAFFYSYFGGSSNVSMGRQELLAQFNSIRKLQTLINIFAKTLIQITITLFPFAIIYYVYRKKLKSLIPIEILQFSVIGSLAGLIAWGMFNQMHDSVQLWGNLYNPIVNVIIFILLISVIKLHQMSKVKIAIFVVLPIAIFYLSSFRSKTFYHPIQPPGEVEKIISSNNPRFSYLKDTTGSESIFSKAEQVYVGQTFSLMRTFDPLVITCINNHQIKLSSKNEKKFQENSTFIKYISTKKENGEFISYKASQVDFVQENKIDFLLVESHQKLPTYLALIFKERSLGVVDGYTVYSREKGH